MANPNKPREIKIILARNHEKLLALLNDLSPGKGDCLLLPFYVRKLQLEHRHFKSTYCIHIVFLFLGPTAFMFDKSLLSS